MVGLCIVLVILLVLMVIGEFVGVSKGFGFYICEKKEFFVMVEVWGGMILIGILGYLLSVLFLKFECWVLCWYY